ncbi:uncharacterized protein TRUGW13939_08121 [Talaromyces rugulosus]|uniref:Uncharacterized protein n=1 Tax=Talaromyces rugulosus TaxID=121627 RepID=A0A7H8R5U8_TALRU|nr:uncharacterized protein TRUGW13939_08121 [Talaromyces rugulosus]QKX60975.1 hypothetical protein TRUGW13939_08121 [Talaromyces rugulosus]
MDAVVSRDFEDWPDWPLQTARRVSYASATTQNSESSLLSARKFASPPSPPTSPAVSDHTRSLGLLPDEVIRLKLSRSVTISFIRKSRLFRIQYGFIDIIKEANGTLKALEMGGQQHTFVHTFANSRLPVPHLENPLLADDTPLRVSFLDEQTVQTSNTTFNTQLSYTFDHWDDCVRFQEILLASKLIFMAGIAEAKSKGRGEECISQNMRLLRGRHERVVLLFFANSQRKERKRYVSVPLNCIDKIDVPKKASRPISLHLLPNFELLAEMKVLQLQFLDDDERKKFGELMTQLLD